MGVINFRFRRLILALCMILNIGLLITTARVSAAPQEVLHLGDVVIAVSGFAGSIQSVIFLLCIVMVCVDNKWGVRFSIVTLFFAFMGSLKATVTSSSLQSLPGVIYNFILLISLLIISNQFTKRVHASKTDSVTGLYNRVGFMERIDEVIAKKKPVHLISIRIRNFYTVRDDLGYEFGDKVLKIAGERVREAAGDKACVSCLDATNFVVLIPADMDGIEVTRKIIHSVTAVIAVEKGNATLHCHLTAYAGIASFPKNAKTTAELLRYSDIAMRHCVNEKKGFLVIFDDGLEQQFVRDGQIEAIVKESLDNGYIYLVYQPQYDATTKRLRGFEVLSRLEMPDGTKISPGEFITTAEKTDLIMHIDRYVLNRAMVEMNRLMEITGTRFVFSVNASAKSISSPYFADAVMEVLAKTKFPADCLELEITEYSFAHSAKQVEKNINKLKDAGIKIALDDFGTGYTSLAQLIKLPIDVLKIDKSLVDGIEESEVSRDFIDSIIYMGHLMNCEVVSEGVESERQLSILKEKKCDMIQGFVWGRPMSLEASIDLAKENM